MEDFFGVLEPQNISGVYRFEGGEQRRRGTYLAYLWRQYPIRQQRTIDRLNDTGVSIPVVELVCPINTVEPKNKASQKKKKNGRTKASRSRRRCTENVLRVREFLRDTRRSRQRVARGRTSHTSSE